MNQTDNTTSTTSTTNFSDTSSQPNVVSGAVVTKEREASPIITAETVQPISHEVEIPPQAEQAGMTATVETIELPPDVKKLGVTSTGTAGSAINTAAVPSVTLPIPDDKVISGLHAQIISSLRWLAVWCVRKLQKAHIILKVIHGKIIRIKTK